MIAKYARKGLVNAFWREPSLLEVSRVAELVHVSQKTVRRWLADGTLEGVHKGLKGYLVPKSSLIAYMCGEVPKGDNEEE